MPVPVRTLILSLAILVRALRSDPGHLLVRAGGGRRLALRALHALFSMTLTDRRS